MEVCVALAVLASEVLVFGRFLDGFTRMRALEREKAHAVINATKTVEEFVRNPPRCRDSSFVGGGVEVSLKAVPGTIPLAWLHTSSVTFDEVKLRRLVRCKKN